MLISAAHDDIQIKLALTSKKMISDVTELLEEILPLNMTYNVQVMWNQHITLKRLHLKNFQNIRTSRSERRF